MRALIWNTDVQAHVMDFDVGSVLTAEVASTFIRLVLSLGARTYKDTAGNDAFGVFPELSTITDIADVEVS